MDIILAPPRGFCAGVDWAIDFDWLEGVNILGISSGASAPEHLVEGVIDAIKANCDVRNVINSITMEENIHFSLPKELQ